MKTIIVDVMGGDNAPLETVKGVARAAAEFGDDIKYILVGDMVQIEAVARENSISLDRFDIVHTESVITMNDEPISVVRGKEYSSMSMGLRMLKEGRGDAFVSTGNTGALFTGANLIVRKIKGVKRPAIATVLPLQTPVLLVDSGANVVVTPEYLEQFAIMGSAYMKNIMNVDSPRVGLLNNGEEEHKGTELQIETYKVLKASENINFVGNVEAKEVPFDVCDVLVTDGFTGNIFLKTIEGMGKFLMGTLKDVMTTNVVTMMSTLTMKEKIKDMKLRFDSSEHGGAPILGISKPVIKAHGSSDAKAIKNAVRQAIFFVETGINDDISVFAEDYDDKKLLSDANAPMGEF